MTTLILPPLRWVRSPNFDVGRTHPIDLVVLHDCEGNYHGSIGWFTEPQSQVSAHIVLREDGGEATQMVQFTDKAWHVVSFNSMSIGVEMAGYGAKGFDAPEWQAAANITAYLLHKFGLPPTWAHGGQGKGFTSHYDLGKLGGGHTDPTRDPKIWQMFVDRVTAAYALVPPSSWSVAPFVPTPTVRRD